MFFSFQFYTNFSHINISFHSMPTTITLLHGILLCISIALYIYTLHYIYSHIVIGDLAFDVCCHSSKKTRCILAIFKIVNQNFLIKSLFKSCLVLRIKFIQQCSIGCVLEFIAFFCFKKKFSRLVRWMNDRYPVQWIVYPYFLPF